MNTEKPASFLNKNVIYSVVPHNCAERDKIALRNLQNQKDRYNLKEAGYTFPQMCRESKPFGKWHLQTYVAYQISEERRA